MQGDHATQDNQTPGLEKEPQGRVREGDWIEGPELHGLVKEGLDEMLSQPRLN